MNRAILATAVLLVAGHLSAADRGMAFGLKLRAQGGLETVDGMRNGFGFGFNTSLPLGPGDLGFELGYQFFSGKQYLEPINTANPFPAGAITEANSVDQRKNTADGLSFRVNYGMTFTETLGWHVGVAVGKLKGRHEAIANFGNGAGTATYGGWATVVEESPVSASPFAGVTYSFGEKGGFEFNVLLASYTIGTAEPAYNTSATGAARVTPLFGEKKINKVKFEICYGFKF